jgi:hypothetical protein
MKYKTQYNIPTKCTRQDVIPFIPFHLAKDARDCFKAYPFAWIQEQLVKNVSKVRL